MIHIDIATGSDFWAAVQAIGGLIGLAIAIMVPTALELLRRREVQRDLIARRRAAWKTMTAVINVLGRKQLVAKGEIHAIGSILDNLDLSVFPEEAVETLVILRNSIAMAAANADRGLSAEAHVKPDFAASTALQNQAAIRPFMGMGNEPVPGARRPRTLPFFPRSRDQPVVASLDDFLG